MAKNLIGGNTTTINESGNDIAVDLNQDYTDFIDINESLQTTANTLPSAINENKGRLDDLMYTENVNIATNLTVAANSNTATATYTLSPREGYTPALVVLNNTWGGQVVLWFLNLTNNTINWRVRNVTSSQVTGFTIQVRVLYVKSESFVGLIN